MTDQGAAINVVVDTSTFIRLERDKRVRLLASLEDHVFHVTDSVGFEIQADQQAEALLEAVAKRYIRLARLDDIAGLEIYARWRKQIDPGESSCIALATLMGWKVAMDDHNGTAEAIEQTIGMEGVLSARDIIDLMRRRARHGRGESKEASSPAAVAITNADL